MSSESNKFETTVLPSDIAASKRHLLLRDFDPGRVTVPSSNLIGLSVRFGVVICFCAAGVVAEAEPADKNVEVLVLVFKDVCCNCEGRRNPGLKEEVWHMYSVNKTIKRQGLTIDDIIVLLDSKLLGVGCL